MKDQGLVSIDRTIAGKSDFQEDFATVHSAPMSWEGKEIRIFLDAHSVELFVNDGELVMTSIVFPNRSWKTVEVSEGISDPKIYPLKIK
jgi:fructan beta-fructosidase